jgi:hypothetical protein
MSRLERLGIRLFKRLSARREPDAERDTRRIQRGAVARASIIGALCTLATSALELHWQPFQEAGDTVGYWIRMGIAVAIFTVVEIALLYWSSLRAVHRIARAAKLDLFPGGDTAVAAAMARAALEIPNPHTNLFGIDPRREASKARLFLATAVYKAKRGLSNFVVKAVLRRVLGRALVRAWLPFVAVPITALWNGVVCWLVMREARIRALGAKAARDQVQAIFAGAPELTDAGKVAALRAVAASVVRKEDMHPNLVVMLEAVTAHVGRPQAEEIDDSKRFLESLPALPPAEQSIVLDLLDLAAILDGRLSGGEKKLLDEARRACGREPDLEPARRRLRAFLDGEMESAPISTRSTSPAR